MRNLVPLSRAAWRLPLETNTSVDHLCFCVNASEQLVYLLNARSGRIDTLAFDDDDAQPELFIELSEAILTDDNTRWQWIEYVAELDAVVCGSLSGLLVAVDLQTREPEEIGSLDGGLLGMAWSSNQATVALATGVGTLLVMNTQWEVLQETQLQTHLPSGLALDISAPVSIAWRDDGHYVVLNVAVTEATKTVRKVLVFTQQLDLHAIGRLEDGRAIPYLGDSIDWCPNHSLITSHETRKDQIFIVFFERNGLRHGEFAIPGEYPASTTSVRQVQWNIQSDIVAVHLETPGEMSRLLLWTRSNYHWYLKQELAFDRTDDHGHFIDFHWDEERSTLMHLLLASQSGGGSTTKYEQVEFAWDVSSGTRRLSNGQSSVVTAVIDGQKLLLTPVHQALVPPPMALHTITFNAPVNSVVFDAIEDMLAVTLSNGAVVLVTNYLAVEEPAPSTRVVRRLHSDTSVNSLLFLRKDASNGDVVVAVKCGAEDRLVVWRVNAILENVEDVETVISSEEVFGVRRGSEIAVVDLNATPHHNEFALQTKRGNIVRVVVDGETANVIPLAPDASHPIFNRLEVVRASADKYLSIGVSSTSKLLVDGVQVSSAAVSSFVFCTYASVLLYTTLGSAAQLRLVPLTALSSATVTENEESRVIERGARLVAVVGDRASVILQMPRGNFEGTSPRLLVLALVVKQITGFEYMKALEMGRRHRIDLNMLVDYDPAMFLDKFSQHLVDAYLKMRPASVTSDRLCLFITNLHVVDVWRTKYWPLLNPFLRATHKPEISNERDGQDKVNRVCKALMVALLDRTADHPDALMLPYLTAAVKQSPPDFHAALSQLQQLLMSIQSSPDSAARAKRAMKHLIFLTQADLLFDEALGMYDLGLVRFVAGYTERDPKEYMPFLDACEAAKDIVVRQYMIDVHLKRFSKALTHLSELLQRSDIDPDLEQEYGQKVLDLVTQGGLFEQALSLFDRSSKNTSVQRLHRSVLQLKAEYLVTQSRFEDAGYVYLAVEAYHDAMQAFKSARAWRMALAAASRAKLDPSTELRTFANEVAHALVHQNDVSLDDVFAAASIYTDYCDDVDEAVALLVTYKQWSESVRVALLHRRADLVETDVETGVAVAFDAFCDDIAQRQHEYVVHWKRLNTIREQKRLFKLHGIDGARWDDGAGHDDTQSVVSGASAADSALSAASSLRSVGSHNSAMRGIGNFSTKSLAAATSSHFYATQSMSNADAIAAAAAYKSKRYNGLPSRAERRRRIKEGSAEEEAHVAKQLVTAAPSAALLRETRDLLRVLVFFGHTHKAESLQQQLSAFETLVRDEYPLPEPMEHAIKWHFPAFTQR